MASKKFCGKIIDFVDVGGNIWFIVEKCNILCRYNKKNGIIDYVAMIPGEMMQAHQLYSAIVVYEKFLVLVPYIAERIAIFDIETFRFEKRDLPVPNREYLYRKRANFYGGLRVDHYVYLIPGEFPEILVLDMNKIEVVERIPWYPHYVTRPANVQMNSYGGIVESVCIDQNILYLTFFAGTKGIIGELLLDTCQLALYKIEEADSYFTFIVNDRDTLYFVTRNGKIISWSKRKRETVSVYSYVAEWDQTDNIYKSCGIFGECILYDDKLYLFWRNRAQYVEFDLRQKIMKEYSFQEMESPIRRIRFAEKKNVYVLTDEYGVLYQVIHGERERIDLYIDDKVMERYFLKVGLHKEASLVENEFFNLANMLPIMANQTKEGIEYGEGGVTDAGKKIYYL